MEIKKNIEVNGGVEEKRYGEEVRWRSGRVLCEYCKTEQNVHMQ